MCFCHPWLGKHPSTGHEDGALLLNSFFGPQRDRHPRERHTHVMVPCKKGVLEHRDVSET